MKCPYCNAVISGHVQMGSDAYYRISKGLCPSCGRSMPSGYKIDFVTSSGEFVSDAREREENRRIMKTAERINAPQNHKRVGFHANFGAIGLLSILFSAFRFVFLRQGNGNIALPIVISVIISIAFRCLLQGITYWHYNQRIKGKNNEKDIVNSETIVLIFIIVSWLFFVLGVFALPILFIQK